jgi:hypothetical protein
VKDPVREDPVRVPNWTLYVSVAVSFAVKLIVSDVPLGIWMLCVLRVWPFMFRLTEVDPFISLLVTWAVITMESPGHGSTGFIDRSLKMYPGVGVGAWIGVTVCWDEVVEVERGDVGEADGEGGKEDAVGEEVGEGDGEGI